MRSESTITETLQQEVLVAAIAPTHRDHAPRPPSTDEVPGKEISHIANCSNCPMRQFCMGDNLDDSETVRLASVIHNWRMVRRGDALYRDGDTFHSLYPLRSGAFKTVVTNQNGCEQVSGFYFTGDTLGLDGICTSRHGCNAIALEDSAVCVIPFRLLEALCREMPSLQRHLHRMLSSEIVRGSGVMFLLASLCADQRVASFLLDISARQHSRGYSRRELSLRMTRQDIGSYLGIKLETVSRTLSRFQGDGLIRVRGRTVTLLDPDTLDCI
ncbi:helix-turn-helix domain-containing protein [Cupriavidus basilensis]|uniref:helix-turn-helix domain-containing protein n=1 Tax=Cupriavidus basilensis TaxID=68895 RepID=UPI0028498BD0|nr:helix-turn-helix domain-containing protein [Cupriavidus basilensis]MDR3379908.1 helix-turn-helix domain-containing protein [Cupriavidus basilensis]